MSSPDMSADDDDLKEESPQRAGVKNSIAEMEGFISMVSGDPYGVGAEKHSYGTVITYKESNHYKIIIDLTVPSRPSIDDIERYTRDLIHHLAVAANRTFPSWTTKGRRTPVVEANRILPSGTTKGRSTPRTWKLKGLRCRRLKVPKAVPKAAAGATSSEVKFLKAEEKKKFSANETKVSKKAASGVRGIVIDDTKEVATKEKECAGKGKQKVYDVTKNLTRAKFQNFRHATGSARDEFASTSNILVTDASPSPTVVEENKTTVVRVSKPRKCKK